MKLIMPLAAGILTVSAITFAGTPDVSAAKKSTMHTVESGEYLSKIAKEYDTKWTRIFDANESIEHPDVINEGQELRIPDDDEKLESRDLPSAAAAAVEASAPAPEPTPQVAYEQPVAAAPAPAPKPQRQAASSSTPSGSVWDSLATCESGGNWSINTGNGFYGGLQFTPGTWGGYKGYANAHQAPRDVQIERAEQVRDARGSYADWPACSAKLGL